MVSGWLYELDLDVQFRASGLDAAHRVAVRVREAVRQALEDDIEARVVERGPHVRPLVGRSNFAPAKRPAEG